MANADKANTISICYYATGHGIRKDGELLKKHLQGAGRQVFVCELSQKNLPDWFYKLRTELWDRLVPQWLKLYALKTILCFARLFIKPQADVTLFLERLHFPTLLRSRRAVLIPNQEWYLERETYALRTLSAVFCKTRHAEAIFQEHCSNVQYISFDSPDQLIETEVQDYSAYLHIAGKSRQKGTLPLLRVWSKHPEWPLLKVVYHHPVPFPISQSSIISQNNIQLISCALPEHEIRHMQNSHGVHICLSEAEGFGHYIVEAMSCKACVITTDAPPMDELISQRHGLLTPVRDMKKQRLGYAYYVDEHQLEQTLGQSIAMPDAAKQQLGEAARHWYLNNKALFATNFNGALATVVGSSKEQSVGVVHEN